MDPETILHFDLSSLDSRLFILAAAAMAALTAFVAARRARFGWLRRSPGATVASYVAAAAEAGDTQPVGDIRLDKNAVITASLGLPATPYTLPGLRLLAGVLPAIGLLILGYPTVLALGAGLLAAILAGTWLQGRWRKFCNQVEQELPTFASRLSGTLLVTASPVAALEDVVSGLGANAPLRSWMDAFLLGLRAPGRTRFVDRAQQDATAVSVSLALVVFEVGRLLETGGSGFTQAFTSTAEHLTSILRTRAVARAKAESARTAVLTMIGVMGLVMLLMMSTKQARQAYQDPTVQLIALVCLAVMGLGYAFLNHMIDEALED